MSIVMSGGGSSGARDSQPVRPVRLVRCGAGAAALALLLTMAAVALGPVAGASAAVRAIVITSPIKGSVMNNHTPTFSGTTDPGLESELSSGEADRIRLKIYEGGVAGGTPVQELTSYSPTARPPTWSIGPVAALPPGTYTAQAEEAIVEPLEGGLSDIVLESSPPSVPVTFTVDTVAPAVTLTAPANGSTTTQSSVQFGGAAGTAERDLHAVTIQLYAGSQAGGQPPIEGVSVPVTTGTWSATLGGLSPGVYTARAEQADEAGNVGASNPVTFTVVAPTPPPVTGPPVAAFKWFPSVPVVGETVSLVSSSVDPFSPLTGFAWSLSSNGSFTPAKPVLTTSFSTPGSHVVRLRATAADGQSSVATATIGVVERQLALMAPFPVVRIAGSVTSSGVKLSLLSVQAPVGARVRVTCRGRGCRRASESRLAASSSKKHRASMVVLTFGRFQGSLGAGAVLEIRVYKQGVIGKYTRFVIRRGKLPLRIDSCIGQAGTKPIPCPA